MQLYNSSHIVLEHFLNVTTPLSESAALLSLNVE